MWPAMSCHVAARQGLRLAKAAVCEQQGAHLVRRPPPPYPPEPALAAARLQLKALQERLAALTAELADTRKQLEAALSIKAAVASASERAKTCALHCF